jgi:hypothetical protein
MKASTSVPASNPFEIGLIARGEHFADREVEVERIAAALRSPGSRLVVYGDRRLGKSSALDRAAGLVRKKKGQVVLVTLATATDPGDAAQQIVRAVQEQTGRNWRRTLEGMAERLQATMEIRPSPVTGAPPSVRFAFGMREQGERGRNLLWDALNAVNAQLEAEKRTIGIGIDEFQRIHEWGGEEAEWSLKAAMETHRNLAYVLAGSKRHLIEAMVSRKGRALWKQVDVLPFPPIDPGILSEWIHQQAARTGVSFSLAACDTIVALAGPRTRDVVQLARAAWGSASRRGEADESTVGAAMDALVREAGALFAALWRERQSVDQRILRALAARRDLEPTAADALQRYRLGPKSTVSSALPRLLEQEVLTRTDEGRYAFDDPFFRRWVQVNALGDLGLPVPALGE